MLSKPVLERIYKDAESAINKDHDDLSDDERFAVCFMSGAEIDYGKISDDRLSLQPSTRNPCAVVRVDGRLVVYEQKR